MQTLLFLALKSKPICSERFELCLEMLRYRKYIKSVQHIMVIAEFTFLTKLNWVFNNVGMAIIFLQFFSP